MPTYTSKQPVKSGVPLGGIGAGKVEILANGMLDYITFQNNWGKPLCNPLNKNSETAKGILGFHFGVFCKGQGRKVSKLLQTENIGHIPTINKIEYKGSYPFARLSFKDKIIPVKLSLEAFSPIIPGQYRESGAPAAVFYLEAENPTRDAHEVSFIFIMKNTVGQSPIGRYNVFKKDKDLTGIICKIKNPTPFDFTAGEFSVSAPRSAGKITYLNGWNLQTKNFKLTPEDIDLEAWDYFQKDGELPDISRDIEIKGGSFELGSAIAVKFKLKAQEKRKIPFFFTWHFPHHNFGHIYQKNYKDSWSAALFFNRNHSKLYKKTLFWQKKLDSLPLPAWLKDALINNLYIYSSSSWWGKNGDFILYEAPVICPLMGTLDVAFYGTVPLAKMFPELDKNMLVQFGMAQRKNGYIPHDLGHERTDMPSDGTTNYFWKDLNPKYVLMVYRDYLWTKDKKFLKAMYPSVKRALDFSFSCDKNGDCLPDNEGADQTFDTWYFYGTNSYTSSIFLASLLAAIKMAMIMKDKKAHDFYKRCFDEGRKSFIKKLWNGKYFIASLNSKGKYDSCIIGQLVGQWYAHMLDLGYILPEEMVKKAVRSIYLLNSRDSRFGATNSILPNGSRDKRFLHSRTIWPGECYAYSALAIYEGYAKFGLEVAKKTWLNIAERNKNPWNQPDIIKPDDGRYGFGDYYMRNAVVWSILLALSKKSKRISRALKKIFPASS